MTFGRRLRFYFFGVILGFVAVYFISKNRDSNPWLPKEQIKAKLASLPISYSSLALCQIDCIQLDTTKLDSIIALSSIDFENSDVRGDECPIYFLEGDLSGQKIITFRLLSCDNNTEIRDVRMSNVSCNCYED